MIEKYVNKKIEKYGYKLVSESVYGAYYEKVEKQLFCHVIAIADKEHGEPIVQSYDKKVLHVDGQYMNEGCGIESSLLFWLWLKKKCLARKYHW